MQLAGVLGSCGFVRRKSLSDVAMIIMILMCCSKNSRNHSHNFQIRNMVIQVVQTVNLAERTSSKRVTLRFDIEMKPEKFLITISSSFQVTGVGRRW